ncbi:MAG: hypothetical protein R3B54_04370 [Bdellovibrionota bacterium]
MKLSIILLFIFSLGAEASGHGNWRAFYDMWSAYHQGDAKTVAVPLRRDPLITDLTDYAWFGECAGQNGKHYSAALYMRYGFENPVGYRVAVFRSLPIGTENDPRIEKALQSSYEAKHLATPEHQEVHAVGVRYPAKARPYFSFPGLIAEFEEPDFHDRKLARIRKAKAAPAATLSALSTTLRRNRRRRQVIGGRNTS